MNIDQRLKLQIGEMMVQLTMAAARIEELEAKLKEMENAQYICEAGSLHGDDRARQGRSEAHWSAASGR